MFAFLEIICFSLVVKYNQTQQDIYVNTVNRGTGFLFETTAKTRHYFSLDDENYRLARENARLLEQLYNQGLDTARTSKIAYRDSLTPQFTFTEARVIKNTVQNHHNYLILDVGKKDGIKPHSGVITNDGVVGIIRKVSNSYAVAMSILHRKMKISARIRGKNFFGSLIWKEEASDPNLFQLQDIPKHAEVAVGDTIETSGYSAIFPDGIFLGTVENTWLEPGENFHTIEVRSKLDMTNIQFVYVVNNLLKEERETLEQSVRADDE